ncbi:AAA family ATPase [Pararhizobium sp. IMCC21322]|uniref:AAA family ATPase n=1 Tax=Pararhizobium sp. IMCC21322 TaxID=3067903 RepID=UPI002741F922|nr:AAA family ATPase [Pararhizobium sp. IMCC21322]
MILKGNERGGAVQLARHLLNTRENEHVRVHEISGFVSDDLTEALTEAYAVSRGTKCKNFMFSLVLSPPETENVSVEAFEQAVAGIESKLGLTGQPRAIIFHEKKGRRHAHCVWSRIDIVRMRALNVSLYKRKLQELSRELFLEHGWQMPRGLMNSEERDQLNYSQVEHQQAKRAQRDPKELKSLLLDCWVGSDSKAAFAAALSEHGLALAKGDRRGFVAVDGQGEVYSLSRWLGVKTKELRARLGDIKKLPSVDAVQLHITERFADKVGAPFDAAYAEAETLFQKQVDAVESKRRALVGDHRQARTALEAAQEARRIKIVKSRVALLPTGVKALWARLSGKYDIMRAEHIQAAEADKIRDQAEMQKLIERQLGERRGLEEQFCTLKEQHVVHLAKLHRENAFELNEQVPGVDLLADPDQALLLPEEDQLYTAQQVRQSPIKILDIITDKKSEFNRRDILRGLANYIDDPLALRAASDAVLRSKELVEIKSDPLPIYSTREMEGLKSGLAHDAKFMAKQKTHGVKPAHTHDAIKRQNAILQKLHGASLSDEQHAAINHILKPERISAAVGLAGTGKSTMLAAAHEAWTKQGYQVFGAALSGKAADGLQNASGIISRTLASMEMSWKNGYNQLKPGDVLVIDEAGMIGTRQMSRFVEHTKTYGAKLVLVGDPEQLQPINAGTPFKDIAENIGAAKLTEIRRQKSDWQRQASLDLATGNTGKAIDAYQKHGAVKTTKSQDDAIAALVQDYMVDIETRGESASRLAFAHRRKDVHAINQAVRMARKSSGELVDEHYFKTTHGKRAFAPNDRIIFTKNDTELGVKNGALATIEKVTKDKIVVTLDGANSDKPRRLTFFPSQYASIDHGYATTIHKSQGATVDRSFVLSSRTLDKHLTYVALTRHKHDARFYSDSDNMPRMKQERAPERDRGLVLRPRR